MKTLAHASLTLIFLVCMSCGDPSAIGVHVPQRSLPLTESGGELRTLDFAVAATQQYVSAAGGTTQALAEIEAWVDALNAVIVPDLSVELNLVANDGSLLSTDINDSISAVNGSTTNLLQASHGWIVDNIAVPFDLGYTIGYSTTQGGLVFIASFCSLSTRGGAVLRIPELPTTGDSFLRTVHQLGHSFGAAHTFNSTSGSCNPTRSSGSAVEPGAGSTLMSFAGLCAPDNLRTDLLSRWHSQSLDEITDRLALRPTCGTTTVVANTPPVVSVGGTSYVIPAGTSFLLEGSATDAEDDPLFYSWEQVDVAGQGSTLADGDLGDVPLFEALPLSDSPSRVFLADPASPPRGEIPPATDRTLTFRLLVMDRNPAGGAFSSAETSVQVVASAGPFVNTTSNTSWVTGTETVTWNIAGTTDPAVGCASVDIALSLDGGATFGLALADAVPNDGSHEVEVPAVISSNAVLRISCSTSVFFSDLAITVDGTQCNIDADCDDGDVCNGVEQCVGIECVDGGALDCDDGLFCNGAESCDPAAGCQPGTDPNSDDGDVCTTDRCDEDTDAIVNEPIAGCPADTDNTNGNTNDNTNDAGTPGGDTGSTGGESGGCNAGGAVPLWALALLALRRRGHRRNELVRDEPLTRQ